MGNLYKRVVYVGIQVEREEILKNLGLARKNGIDDGFYDFTEKHKLWLNAHEGLLRKIGQINTDDSLICIGKVIDASGECEIPERHLDIMEKFEEAKYEVSEYLRKLGISIGDIGIHATTHCY